MFRKNKKMSKAIVLDVDGVIIGEKKGVNTPHPHMEVMRFLKNTRASGVPVILCTAKPAFAIEYEVKEAKLNNPHIADGGGLLVDNQGNVYQKYTLNAELSKQIISHLLENNVYTEVYTADDYYIQSSQQCEITDQHTFVLQRKPQIVDSLISFCDHHEITKIMQVVQNESNKPFGEQVFTPFADKASMVWAVHPPILPLQFGIITAQGISKPDGVKQISDILQIPLDNMLAVGDSTSDWRFMSLCGYVGAMGNASDKLKELVRTKGAERYIIGDTVDNNGIINIIKWYLSI